MSGFSSEWLALREPADHAARDLAITSELAARLPERGKPLAVDLACGTGSNARYLIPRLPYIRHWVLVDNDATLLQIAEEMLAPLAARHDVTIEVVQLDLANIERLPLDACGLVTASAWLDLASDAWLRALAARCRDVQADVLFPLNYDGRISCVPRDPHDERIRDLVNRHQRTDKGLGAALGPGATPAAESAFEEWEVVVAASDWNLAAGTEALQVELVNGWAYAAKEMAPEVATQIDAWLARRLSHVGAGASRIVVGHLDLAAWDRPLGVPLGGPAAG